MYQYTDVDGNIGDLVVIDDNHLRVVARTSITYSISHYLGIITRADRSVIWTNNSKPIP